jgi:hypothetical protein
MLGKVYRRIASRISRHPSDDLLLSLSHREINGESLDRIVAHVGRCQRCSKKKEQLEQEWKGIAALGAGTAVLSKLAEEELIHKIQSSMSAQVDCNNPADLKPAPSDPEAERQVEEMLGTFLGKRAAAALLRKEQDSANAAIPGSLEDILPILRALLGSRGAEAIERRFLRLTNQPVLAPDFRGHDSYSGKRA